MPGDASPSMSEARVYRIADVAVATLAPVVADPEHGNQLDQAEEREHRTGQVAIHGEHHNFKQGLWLAAILIWGLALVFWGFLIRPGPNGTGPAASDPAQVATPRAMLGLWQAPRDDQPASRLAQSGEWSAAHPLPVQAILLLPPREEPDQRGPVPGYAFRTTSHRLPRV